MTARIKVLVAVPQSTVDALFQPAVRDRLNSIADVVWSTNLDSKTPTETFASAIKAASPDIIVSGWSAPKLTAAICRQNPQLKYAVVLTGTVCPFIERDCIVNGLIVTNWGDVISASIAEAALMMTLMSLRHAVEWQTIMHIERGWKLPDDRPQIQPLGLFDKTVGLYGFGQIARKFVEMLDPFDVRLVTYSPYDSDAILKEYGVSRAKSLAELFERSDIVSVHAGLTDETRGSVNAAVLSKLKTGGHLINTARGAIIDTNALVDELKTGRINAALDVYEQEPLPAEHPLRELRNCLLFPHQAGPTVDYRFRCGVNAVEQIERIAAGIAPRYVIDAASFDRMT